MSNQDSPKSQRDRFLAFSFATSDLLIEIDGKGKIVFAMGAGKSMIGIDTQNMVSKDWLDIFLPSYKVTALSMYKTAKDGQRVGPILIRLDDSIANQREALVTGIRMPHNNHFYIGLAFAKDLVEKITQIHEEIADPQISQKRFADTAKQMIQQAQGEGKNVGLTLFDIKNTADFQNEFGDEMWDELTNTLTDVLKSYSVDGQTASQISDGKYGIVHDNSMDASTLKAKLAEISKEALPEGNTLEFESKTIDPDLHALSEKEASRAILYTLNEFEKQGSDISIDTLQSGFKGFLEKNTQRISHLKSTIDNLNFELHFQPIVDFKTLRPSHFEMLSRFKFEQDTTEDIINFIEDVGMAADIDLAVCKRAINYITYKGSANSFKFAVNLSGQSIQNEQFFKRLTRKLSEHKNLNERLLFEITESSEIKELSKVNDFIQTLRTKGYKICLDDFGAGSASIQYAHQLEVDYLKIDGKYTMGLTKNHKDRIMVKTMASLAHDLNMKIVSERVETLDEIKILHELGVQYGQGYLFAKPKPRPEFSATRTLEKFIKTLK